MTEYQWAEQHMPDGTNSSVPAGYEWQGTATPFAISTKRGSIPMRKLLGILHHAVAGAAVLGLLAAGEVIAADGTAEEAKAMLERAVAVLKADEAAALAAFTAGSQGFTDRDLYVFCGDAVDGTTTAHGGDPARVGQSMRDVTDQTGKKFGNEFYKVAEEGEFNVVEYVWPRSGETQGAPKASYVTKVGDQICGVGFYK